MELDSVLRWTDLAREIAGSERLAIVLAMIWVESRGNADSVNAKSGATGLMQVMPYDPERTGEMFVGRPTSEELADPRINIEWGVRILDYYQNKEGGLWGALYRYSGGRTWPSYGDFVKRYWMPFSEVMGGIEAALREIEEDAGEGS